MLGALIGDIIGSQYEYIDAKGRDLPLYEKNKSTFTDDSILSLATAKALTSNTRDFKTAYLDYFHGYSGQKANGPGVGPGFGGMFVRWAMGEDEEYAPYNSWGNGGAMRVSPIVWFASDEAEALDLAEQSASVTHNHVEGVKGAQAIVLAGFMARQGSSKDDIYAAITDRFGYRFNFTLDHLHEHYFFAETAHQSVPQAIMCALEASCYEDAIRNVLYIGGDTDTLAAMAGTISQAMHGLPKRFYRYLEPLKLYAPNLYSEAIEFHMTYCECNEPHVLDIKPVYRFIRLLRKQY
ncbi:ADP-ribosylglycohydrolase family protein [Vibrio owensii]|uniref:ADP-ribosylglycohydrolase family protein n=1 Tax=Vibrio owensii TaxID=696485 RepID=UPI003CC6CD9D